jgi:asparagine synthase (glutamine-hydrolysing)
VLSRFARERVTVALGGDGGDELFGGYPMHQAHRLVARASFGTALSPILARAARLLPVSHRNFDLRFKALTFLRGAAAPAPVNHALWMASFPPDAKRALLRARGNGADPALAAFERAWAGSAGSPLLARATHLDAVTYLPNDILTKVDRASMSVALEVRAPFLARDVVEFAFSLPDVFRMKGLTGKRLLRDAARDLLPAAIIDRPKKGFGMPVASWLAGPLRPLVRDIFAPDAVRAAGLFQPEAITRMVDEHEAGQADHRKPLWTLLVFELWRRHHVMDRARAVAAAAP